MTAKGGEGRGGIEEKRLMDMDNSVVIAGLGEVKNKKWRSQRTYRYDPWT